MTIWNRSRLWKACGIPLIAVLIGYLMFNNPSADFYSSDGVWGDGEIVFKGRTFERVIVWNFERYKSECSAASARLLRATSRNWINIFAWPSYLTNTKWRVPYSPEPAGIDNLGSYDCHVAVGSAVDAAEIHKKAAQFLSALRKAPATFSR